MGWKQLIKPTFQAKPVTITQYRSLKQQRLVSGLKFSKVMQGVGFQPIPHHNLLPKSSMPCANELYPLISPFMGDN
jgi:hypothetical protein